MPYEIVESRKLAGVEIDGYDVNGPRDGSKELQVKDNAYSTVSVAMY